MLAGNISNEMLKSGITTLLPCLHKLFNLVFSSGIYPTAWATGYITPILKTGDCRQAGNYRGITINSNIGKLFNMILNSHLDQYLEENNIIDACQIGFKKGARTSDHMFVLKTLIDKYINQPGGRLFTCFVDFKKAFDTVIHPGIKFKLKENHIGGNFYNILCSLYSKNNVCVKLGEKHTSFFNSKIGVRQGDVLSPNLFKLYINDFPKYLQNLPGTVFLNSIPLQCLMYADDIVILSSSREGLQKRLDKLSLFCKEWCLNVNIDKTKIIIFNKNGTLIKHEFKFESETLECVKHYRYLGVYFSSSGIFNFAQDDIYKRALKASFKLTKLVSSSEPSIKTSLHLFDHLIKPIVLYGAEIWGMFKTNSSACKTDDKFAFQNIYKNNIADKAHIRYLKYILGVNKYSSNFAVLSETGRYPMFFSIVISIIKYLYRLENSENGLLYEAFKLNKSLHDKNVTTWFSSALFILRLLNIEVSLVSSLSEMELISIVKSKLINKFEKYWLTEREKLSSGKLTTYFKVKNTFHQEKYLSINKFKLRKAMCRFRISAHDLRIESGRYAKNYINRTDRICTRCDAHEVENEFHFLLNCSLYHDERENLFNRINLLNTNFRFLNLTDKGLWLLTQEDLNILEHLASFIENCFLKRKIHYV